MVSFQQHGCWRGHRPALTTHLFCTCSRAIYRILSRSAIYILAFHLGMSIDTSCTQCIIESLEAGSDDDCPDPWHPRSISCAIVTCCTCISKPFTSQDTQLEVCSKNSMDSAPTATSQADSGKIICQVYPNLLATESWLNLHFVVLRRFLCLGRCLQILPLLSNVSIQTYPKHPKLKRTS